MLQGGGKVIQRCNEIRELKGAFHIELGIATAKTRPSPSCLLFPNMLARLLALLKRAWRVMASLLGVSAGCALAWVSV
jgi:hypothetical protein